MLNAMIRSLICLIVITSSTTYCRQHGTWPKAVSGWDPIAQPEKFFEFMPIKRVDAGYPPTVLIHGTADTDVPHEQSVMMARALKQHGVARTRPRSG